MALDQDDHDERAVWRVGRDEQGNAVLSWTPTSRSVDPEPQEETDELAQTYSYLRRLDVSALSIEGETEDGSPEEGFDPYNTGAWRKCSRL